VGICTPEVLLYGICMCTFHYDGPEVLLYSICLCIFHCVRSGSTSVQHLHVYISLCMVRKYFCTAFCICTFHYVRSILGKETVVRYCTSYLRDRWSTGTCTYGVHRYIHTALMYSVPSVPSPIHARTTFSTVLGVHNNVEVCGVIDRHFDND
jgi:hypothetical protein